MRRMLYCMYLSAVWQYFREGAGVVARVTSLRCQNKTNWGREGAWKNASISWVRSCYCTMQLRQDGCATTLDPTGLSCCCFHCCWSTEEVDYIRCTWQARGSRSNASLCVCACPDVDFLNGCWPLPWLPHRRNPDHQVWLESSLQNRRGDGSHAWVAHMLRPLSLSLWTLLIGHLQLPNTHPCHAFSSHSGVLKQPGM